MWLAPRNSEQGDGSMLVAGTSRRLRLPADRRLRRVLLAYGISTLVEFATWLTILLVAYDRGGPVGVGVASFAMLLPAIMLVPLLAGFGDRLPRGRALSLAYLVRRDQLGCHRRPGRRRGAVLVGPGRWGGPHHRCQPGAPHALRSPAVPRVPAR